MKKREIIERYGEAAYERVLEQNRARYKAHLKENRAKSRDWRERNPEKVKAYNHEINRKGGKRYDKTLEYDRTGLRGKKNAIRNKHQKQYRLYKNIIAPESQIHHEWIPKTAEYRGVALVEANPHRYGIIDVIQILDGEITLLTEEEVKEEEEKL